MPPVASVDENGPVPHAEELVHHCYGCIVTQALRGFAQGQDGFTATPGEFGLVRITDRIHQTSDTHY